MNYPINPYGGQPTAAPANSPARSQAVERSRTAMETVSDGYMGVVTVASLNAITQYGMESVRQVNAKRMEILAEHPDLEPALTGLLYNHARLIAETQNNVANPLKRG